MTDDAGLVRDTGRFDLESDVVVVGGGGCGLTAAIAAAQGEVDVLVLEKQARPWCNTARSGGMVPAELDWHHVHNLDLLATALQHQGLMGRAEATMREAAALVRLPLVSLFG